MRGEAANRVTFVRWPAERDLREQCTVHRRPCLLVVEHGAPPPENVGLHEDWVRPPIAPEDLQARVRQLTARTFLRSRPVLDPAGILYFKESSVTLSVTQCEMLAPLVGRHGQTVYRIELRDILERSGASSSSNALDLHVMRLRRRLRVVGLAVRNVRGRGFVLEPT
ncbi:winged helix-turn-helix domain-containing protein [Streptomyces salinarius]|uniref:winged helix-turn-helix domain-containing protein n=1 Tax=Streptomyces salinarius TaxID=2762598 RepID=UPI001644A6D7|nr:winged helix-turn-helix domain-containing protein [Streptomyces salinarius]